MSSTQRPWLLQLGPLMIPTDAREELNAIRTGMAAGHYSDAIWALRYHNCLAEDYCLPPGKSSIAGWPYKTAQQRAMDEAKAVDARVGVTPLRKTVEK